MFKTKELKELLGQATENFGTEEIGSKRHLENCAAIEQVEKEFANLAAELIRCRGLLERACIDADKQPRPHPIWCIEARNYLSETEG